MIKLLELFGGIGACSKALDNLGIDYKVMDYVEIDKYAVASYNALHDSKFVVQDITEWDKDIEVDLLMTGSPCQDFSLSGLQAGGDPGSGTRSSLMYENIRIIEKLKPKYVVWENVRNLLSKKHKPNFDAYLEAMSNMGYTNYWQVLNAKNYGIPQHRERMFVVSIREDQEFVFPPAIPLNCTLDDYLDEVVGDQHYLSEKMIKYISSTGTKNFHNHDCRINLDIARPLTTAPNKRAGTTTYICEGLPHNYNLTGDEDPNLKIRRLTPREYWKLMGFTDEDFDKVKDINSNTQLYKQAGNSIVVPVLQQILANLLIKGE